MEKRRFLAFLVLLFLLVSLMARGEVSFAVLAQDSKNGNLEQVPLLNGLPESSRFAMLVVSFNRTFGGSENDYFYSVINTLDNGFLFVGGTDSYGSGDTDFWIVKANSSGRMQWAKSYGRAGKEEAHSVVQTSDGGFAILGTTSSFSSELEYDFWLVKIDSLGNLLWNRTYGGTGTDDGWSIIELASSELVLVGWTSSYGNGSGDSYLIKTDRDGNLLWNRTYGGPQLDVSSSIREAVGGGFILAGYTYSLGAGASDFWLIRTDAWGNQVWNRTLGGIGDDFCFSVARTTDGGYAALGSTSSFGAGVYDFWLAKLDQTGIVLWNRTYGGSGYDEGWTIIQASGGDLGCVGWTESYGSGKSDCWLIATDAQGNIKSEKVWGGTEYDYAYGGVLASNKVYVLAGQTTSFGIGGYDSLLLGLGKLGDVNRDGIINVLDLILVANALGTHPGDPKWNPGADLNQDGSINVLDLIVVATYLGA